MNNIIFCLDKKFLVQINYVFKTFILFHNIDKYFFYFILFDEDKELHINLKKILNKISKNLKFKYEYFNPPNEFKTMIEDYNNIIFNYKIPPHTVFNNLANWSRFFISNIFKDLDKGLYLDLDILFNGNIDDIFTIDISKKIIAVVPYTENDSTLYHNFKNNSSLNKLIKNNKKIIDNFNETNILDTNNLILKIIKENNNFLKLLNCFNLTVDDLKNQKYNAGVIYFNFKLFYEKNIFAEFEKLIKFVINNNYTFLKTGTEKTLNLLINDYEILDNKYNFIFNEKKINYVNEKVIIHFKGQYDLPNNLYKEIFNNILNKVKTIVKLYKLFLTKKKKNANFLHL